MIKSIVFILTLLAFGTTFKSNNGSKKDFYTYSKSGDLWRVPLVEPYEIVSPTNSGSDDWFLILKNHTIKGSNYFRSRDEFHLSSIKIIGILDSVIVATNENEYWPKLSGQYPSTLIIDLKTNNQFLFSNEHHSIKLKEKMTELKVEEIEMLEWKVIKNDFLENLKLPKNLNDQRLTTKSKLH